MNYYTSYMEETDPNEVASILDSIAEFHLNQGFATFRGRNGSVHIELDDEAADLYLIPCQRGIRVTKRLRKHIRNFV